MYYKDHVYYKTILFKFLDKQNLSFNISPEEFPKIGTVRGVNFSVLFYSIHSWPQSPHTCVNEVTGGLPGGLLYYHKLFYFSKE